MPYMRVTRARFDPDRYDEVVQAVAASGAVVAQLPGFHRNHAATDRTSGHGIAFTVFDTLEHARFSRAAARAADGEGRMLQLYTVGVTPAAPEFYEVIS